jgi:hypothetical protein
MQGGGAQTPHAECQMVWHVQRVSKGLEAHAWRRREGGRSNRPRVRGPKVLLVHSSALVSSEIVGHGTLLDTTLVGEWHDCSNGYLLQDLFARSPSISKSNLRSCVTILIECAVNRFVAAIQAHF